MVIACINPPLLEQWKKKGEIIAIWRCDRCFKKVPFYKTDNPMVNEIYRQAAKEKYCNHCKKKLQQIPEQKEIIIKEIRLLKKYEGIIVKKVDEEFDEAPTEHLKTLLT